MHFTLHTLAVPSKEFNYSSRSVSLLINIELEIKFYRGISYHHRNPLPRSTSSSVVRATLFAGVRLHSLSLRHRWHWQMGPQIGKWDKKKNIKQNPLSFTFFEGVEMRRKGWGCQQKMQRDGRYNPIQGQSCAAIWQLQETISSCQTSHRQSCRETYGEGRAASAPFQVISKAMFQLQSSHLEKWNNIQKKVGIFSLFDNL